MAGRLGGRGRRSLSFLMPYHRPDIVPGETRTWDSIYDLLNAIHHAEEGVQHASSAAGHARQIHDDELAEFFERWERDLRSAAEEARRLVEERRRGGATARDVVEEASMESF